MGAGSIILKAIGGALEGAGAAANKNAQMQNGAEINNDTFKEGMYNAMGGGLNKGKSEDKGAILSNIAEGMKEGKGKDFMMKAGTALKSFSDERLKDLFEDDDRIDYLAKVNSYDFTYKPEAQEDLGVDGLEHTGIIVQELEKNPAFKGCTTKDPKSGFGMVKIPELTMSNTAGLGDLARGYENLEARITELERIIGDR